MVLGFYPQIPFATLSEILPLGKLKAYITECFHHLLK